MPQAAITASSAIPATVLRSPLLPAISEGVAAMPPAEAFRVMLRIISAMIAGVALCAARRPAGHPVRESAQELVKVLPALGGRPEDCRLDQLLQLTEVVGAKIWRLAAFQSDREVKAYLEKLVASICQPADLVQRTSPDTHIVRV